MVVVPNFDPGGIGFGLAEMVAEEAVSLEAVVSLFSEDEDGKRLQEAKQSIKPRVKTTRVFICRDERSADSTGRKSNRH